MRLLGRTSSRISSTRATARRHRQCVISQCLPSPSTPDFCLCMHAYMHACAHMRKLSWDCGGHQVSSVLNKALLGEATSNYEMPLYHKNGNCVEIFLNASPQAPGTRSLIYAVDPVHESSTFFIGACIGSTTMTVRLWVSSAWARTSVSSKKPRTISGKKRTTFALCRLATHATCHAHVLCIACVDTRWHIAWVGSHKLVWFCRWSPSR